ncbi:UDP-2,4-diacetamido-2,4,6-trideoxy-beta-L-altropyranose hydrolase [Aliarcobacter cryaerophilus]|uniref:UDP-2,4-diacetamido-2,4, 6-trideoxy-beta-L-altropyranose hydrolase n=2 Tax=unclassified Arcobacter TaxID=2593671 RepID=A0AA96CYS4_9BACT|nr:UDP-2,4-diacetamido-2,4,6-trideoxy-beta-L-altropyranose hydrolase [Arcobacter sp. AZ-2023]WPD09089.1 UDP-2,4-diacetamido-2,4,6-trideoxy-beta-L-altropyranose hydrolase [Arcobacter sp. DSM 115954]WNL13921.1 UDP-2,4-diacetamido-2,4,6-trideoxy-beta-L-altropyranose hydrolase [Arcobacter sp. AZ-2023]WNL18073.1 UDP-2,4-diacetamido-2,4,6-trideoxy-beta-L-altropyranose hydrolase [Arcobacter sp. AZ-2023]WNL22341.1 UDP-2,4-diacetamido-2,4,6-trideoxy-beta-L-altropyranose hydrolase [Arcobacter sp. AZ-2023
MNILVRADSSSNIGTGHIMRDLVLAKEYKNENIIFATQDLVGNINHQIIETGYKIELLKSNDFEELNDLIKRLNIDMIIIDNYDIDYNFEKKLKEDNSSLKIFVLDDTYEKHFCDILLNHNIYADEKKYKNKVPENCELRCGAKYTLLRDEFLEAKKAKKRVKKKNQTIFLGLGGADHKNLNIKILKVVERFKKSLKVNLVTTTANKHLEELKGYCKDKKWINLQINSNKVAKLMSKSDFVIVTPSVTANEIFYLDLPMITIKTAKNQNQMHKYLKKKGYFTMKKFDKQKLNKYLKLFLKR